MNAWLVLNGHGPGLQMLSPGGEWAPATDLEWRRRKSESIFEAVTFESETRLPYADLGGGQSGSDSPESDVALVADPTRGRE